MRPDPLGNLLDASSRGDTEAFADLYDAVAGRLYGLVHRILRDAHQSEEVTQEVFLEIWRTCGRFDPDRGSAASWMHTLAHRRAVDRVRQAEASRRRDTAHLESTWTRPFDETVASAESSMEADRVRSALSLLSPVQRQAIELAYFGGFSHSEVSRLLHVPLGTAKTRIRDGLIKLRHALTPLEPEPAL